MDVLIRPYVDSDFDLITSIWLRSWQSTGIPSPVTLDELRERWPQELTRGWIVHVATIEPEIVGFLAHHRDKLEQLFVAPDYQGRGFGKQLLDLAKKQMPSGFHLTTALQSRAGRFFEREGLSRSEESVHPRFGHKIIQFYWGPVSDV